MAQHKPPLEPEAVPVPREEHPPEPKVSAQPAAQDKPPPEEEMPAGVAQGEQHPSKPAPPARPPWMLPSFKPEGVPLGDPVEEWVSANDSRAIELINTCFWMMTTGATLSSEDVLNMFGRQRLREATKYFHDQVLEQSLELQRRRPQKGRPPSNEKLMGADIDQALRNIGLSEEQVRQFWTEITAIRAKPTDAPSTLRQRRSRASRRKA
jgi:hypothetical protein